jgi:hypothetical protein
VTLLRSKIIIMTRVSIIIFNRYDHSQKIGKTYILIILTELLTLLEKFDSPPIFFVESVLLIILVLRSVVVFSGMAWGLVG